MATHASAASDVCIAGAGIIGLSLARALAHAGLRVTVLTSGEAMAAASTAAAGMLAVEDPDNPPELRALSRLSGSLYPCFLEELADEGGLRVRPQTAQTLQVLLPGQALPAGAVDLRDDDPLAGTVQLRGGERLVALEEHSLDPRELAAALLASLPSAGVDLQCHTAVLQAAAAGDGVSLETTAGPVHAGAFVDCSGAWSLGTSLAPQLRIVPRKGQMLTVATPAPLAAAQAVLRSHAIYLVPRLHGPRAGQCVVGATIEDAGFDMAVHPHDLDALLARAADLLPALRTATVVDSWAGLRPATADLLPVLGRLPTPAAASSGSNLFIASGHFRNGILLAPATAAVMTELLLGRTPSVPLADFAPDRFRPVPA